MWDLNIRTSHVRHPFPRVPYRTLLSLSLSLSFYSFFLLSLSLSLSLLHRHTHSLCLSLSHSRAVLISKSYTINPAPSTQRHQTGRGARGAAQPGGRAQRQGASRVQGSGFRIQGSGFRVQGSGFRVQSSGFRRTVAAFNAVGRARSAARCLPTSIKCGHARGTSQFWLLKSLSVLTFGKANKNEGL